MMRSLTRSLIVIVGSTILIAVLGWLTRIVEIPLRLTSRIDSDAGRTVVLRTDFSDEAAWRSLEAAIQAAGGEFRSFVRFVSDPAQATMTSDQIVDFARREERTFIFVVDRLTLTG